MLNQRRKREIEAEEKKESVVVLSISRLFRNLDVSFNMTVYSIYLIYLIFSILNGVGIQAINIILAVMTAAFMITYLVLRMSGRKKGRQIKRLKRYYRNFKLVAKTVTTLTAVYVLITAIKSVSPFAIIAAFLGLVFLILKIIVEIILHIIRIKVMRVKKRVTDGISRIRSRFELDGTGEAPEAEDEPAYSRKRRKTAAQRRKEKLSGEPEDIFIPVDQCLLYDIEDF